MVVRDEDVDAAPLGDRDLRARARAAVDRDDDRDPAGHRGVDRGERQAVPLLEPARHVGLDRDAEASQRDDQDREPVEAIGIEVAEHHDPLTAVARESEPVEQAIGIGQEPWIVQPIDRLGEPGRELGGAGHPAACQETGHALRQPAIQRRGQELRVDGMTLREAPAEARFEHPLRMPCGAHLRLVGGWIRPAERVIRTRRDERAGRGRSAVDRGGDPPRRSSRPATETRRRSRNTCR